LRNGRGNSHILNLASGMLRVVRAIKP
jgi:hypothetical protein